MYIATGSEKFWASHFLQQGGGVYVGQPYQRGVGLGNVFRAIYRAVAPAAKRLGRAAAPVIKHFGSEALRTGAEITEDLLEGQNFKKSARKRTKEAAVRNLKKAKNKVLKTGYKELKNEQEGGLLGIRGAKNGKTTKKKAKAVKLTKKPKKVKKKTTKTDIFG